jgi:hypothetical protein
MNSLVCNSFNAKASATGFPPLAVFSLQERHGCSGLTWVLIGAIVIWMLQQPDGASVRACCDGCYYCLYPWSLHVLSSTLLYSVLNSPYWHSYYYDQKLGELAVTDWDLEDHHYLVAPATDIQVFTLKCYRNKIQIPCSVHVERARSQEWQHLVSNSRLGIDKPNSLTLY